jgi:hypothetical protein
MTICYRDGYKYQLAAEYRVQTTLRPPWVVKSDFLLLKPDGLLVIRKGYAWDGPSGPTIDTRSSMRGSLVHDALYQMIREGLLPATARLRADEELRRLCIEDGMWKWRAALWFRAVSKAAAGAADPAHDRVVYAAP